MELFLKLLETDTIRMRHRRWNRDDGL